MRTTCPGGGAAGGLPPPWAGPPFPASGSPLESKAGRPAKLRKRCLPWDQSARSSHPSHPRGRGSTLQSWLVSRRISSALSRRARRPSPVPAHGEGGFKKVTQVLTLLPLRGRVSVCPGTWELMVSSPAACSGNAAPGLQGLVRKGRASPPPPYPLGHSLCGKPAALQESTLDLSCRGGHVRCSDPSPAGLPEVRTSAAGHAQPVHLNTTT